MSRLTQVISGMVSANYLTAAKIGLNQVKLQPNNNTKKKLNNIYKNIQIQSLPRYLLTSSGQEHSRPIQQSPWPTRCKLNGVYLHSVTSTLQTSILDVWEMLVIL